MPSTSLLAAACRRGTPLPLAAPPSRTHSKAAALPSPSSTSASRVSHQASGHFITHTLTRQQDRGLIALLYVPCEKLLLSVSYDKVLRVYDATTRALKGSWRSESGGHFTDVAFDSEKMLVGGGGLLGAGCEAGSQTAGRCCMACGTTASCMLQRPASAML
jgi:hypothetical protein